MFISDTVIENMASPGFLIGLDGDFLRINRHGYTLLERVLGTRRIANIRELDPAFDPRLRVEQIRELQIGKLCLTTHLYPCLSQPGSSGDVGGILYVMDNVLFNADLVRLLDSFEDVVTISNPQGIIEFVNSASYAMTGERYGVGTDVHDMKNDQILNEPITLDVLRSRKPVASRVAYRSGSTLLNRAYPLFGENGEIEKVIILAQNATSLLLVDEGLYVKERQGKGQGPEAEELAELLKEKNVIAASAAMRRIFAMAYKVAASDAPVFLQGESGVGKEIVAEFIHRTSKRNQMPLVSVNCSAIPQELFESEMFGYEKGAFTGANHLGKRGLFEMAEGGSVFLDEIGELPLPMQSKLLRSIQEGKIRRIGGTKDIPINVRYISATNLSMAKVLDENYFRRDLYYRLSVVSLMIPPLRERREDILPLISYYLQHSNEKNYGGQADRYVRISKEDMHELVGYAWPGNIRELRNTVERIVILSESGLANGVPCDILPPGAGTRTPPPPVRKRVGNERILELYRSCGSIHETAKQLGIAPSTIYRRIKSGKLLLRYP